MLLMTSLSLAWTMDRLGKKQTKKQTKNKQTYLLVFHRPALTLENSFDCTKENYGKTFF